MLHLFTYDSLRVIIISTSWPAIRLPSNQSEIVDKKTGLIWKFPQKMCSCPVFECPIKLALVVLVVFCGHVASGTTVMVGPTFDNLNDLKTRLNEEKRMIQHVIAYIVSIFDYTFEFNCQNCFHKVVVVSWRFCKVNPKKLHAPSRHLYTHKYHNCTHKVVKTYQCTWRAWFVG